MRKIVRSTLLLAVGGGAAAVAALLAGVDRSDVVLDAYLVSLAGLAALAAARAALVSFPSPRGVVPRAIAQRAEQASVPESLAGMDGMVALAQADELDFHVRLRPVLADIAAAGYAATAGSAERGLPPAAEAAFSPETWALVRPDRPRPDGAGVRGIGSRELAAALGELESKLAP